IIETMSDLLEAKAALLAVKENSALPAYVTMTYASDGRTFLGTDPKTAALTLSALGADAVGLNCSLGPQELLPLVEETLRWSLAPVIVQPNAGLPEIVDGRTVYRVEPEEFAALMGKMLDMGVSLAGGCCGTTPAHIAALRREADRRRPVWQRPARKCFFTSAQRAVVLEGSAIGVIGERINPTGKKRVKEALRTRNYDYIVSEAISQEEAGADLLDVNAGLPELDEPKVLEALVGALQAVTPLPLQLDSSDPAALERAARVYCGKPVLNSVNGKEESLAAILPIAKRYGCAVVGLTLDENGIPRSAEERFRIAEKILHRALQLGIPKEDVLIDCLVMTVSTDQSLARETLRAVRLVKERLGVRTVLGVSNVSFGLPAREVINAAFLAEALGAGLDLPILNPLSTRYMDIVAAHRVLSGEDTGSERFITKYAALKPASQPAAETGVLSIREIVLTGRKLLIQDAVRAALRESSPMEVINSLLIPAINAAGERFERGEFFLPQLMSAAETVKLGFDVVKAQAETGEVAAKGTVLLATVKGDVHDIGKNIVKMLLLNYGYEVIDLGRDVPPEAVVHEVQARGIRLVGLSALMTTTVGSMADTVKALRAAGADCKIMVGGAVLTEEYARMVGADYYAKDAADSARIAEEVFSR
ncbi:MAG: homocysteine S-methyltransferase family protein, partial [bacterium]